MFSRLQLAGLVLALTMIGVGLWWPSSSLPIVVDQPVAVEAQTVFVEPVQNAVQQEPHHQDATRIIVSEQLQSDSWHTGALQEKVVIGDQVVVPQVQQKKGLGSSVDE